MQQTLIAAIVAALLGGTVAWKWQAHKYDAQINAEHLAQQKSITDDVTNALKKERQNANAKAKLDASAATAQARTAETGRVARDSIARNGLWLHTTTGCARPQSMPVAASPTQPAADSASVVRLSDEDAAALQSETERADNAADYARIGHDYAILMQQWAASQSQ